MVHVKLPRVGKNSPRIRVRPLARNHPAAVLGKSHGNERLLYQHFVPRVLTVAVGVSPSGKPLLAVVLGTSVGLLPALRVGAPVTVTLPGFPIGVAPLLVETPAVRKRGMTPEQDGANFF